MDLPNEIVLQIVDYISDTKTFLNLRILSKKYYEYFNEVKIFEGNKLVYKIRVNNNEKIIIRENNLLGLLPGSPDYIREVYIINRHGNFTYNKFKNDPLGLLSGSPDKLIEEIIYDPPYKLKFREINEDSKTYKNCDLSQATSEFSKYIIPSNFNCCIS